MSKRGDNVHKRKDGRWEGRYMKGRKENGTILYHSVYGKSYKEVKEKLAEAKTIVIQNGYIKTNEKYFKDVLALWMESNRVRLKGSTVMKYQSIIDTHILPDLGMVSLSKLTSTQINSFLMNKLESGRLDNKGGLSPSYVRSIMLVINAALKFAVSEQMCLPLKTPIYKPNISKHTLKILSVEAQSKLEKFLMEEINATKLGILISLHTGIRIGEVCALTWKDVDLRENIIHIRHTVARVQTHTPDAETSTCLIIDRPKTDAAIRDIPISSFLKSVLCSMQKSSEIKYVISETETFVSPRTYEYRFHSLLKKCGIESVNYHALRHTFATRCIEAGVDIKSLSEILGHSNVNVTLNTYVHSSMDMKRMQLEKLTNLLN